MREDHGWTVFPLEQDDKTALRAMHQVVMENAAGAVVRTRS